MEVVMAILDASPFQNWMRAFDNWDRAQRRYDAAGRSGNNALISYVEADMESARLSLNAALKELNDIPADAGRFIGEG